MAKIRRYDSDYMSRKCDDELEQLEERLTALYANASNEVLSEYTDWISKYEKQDEKMRQKYESGEIDDDEYSRWRRNTMLQNQKYTETVKSLTDILVSTDQAAMAIVRDELPLVVAESYNFTQALGYAAADEAGLSVGTFQVYNARTVQALIRDNPNLLPKVDIAEDKKWNKDRINREITQGIVKGDSIPKVAERLQAVTNMDKNAAVRNARTTMTGAENLGRNEGFHDLKDKGIPARMQWSATHDNRTRDTHILLDGTYQDEDGYFGDGILLNPIRYPADPLGDPEEIYNCRCRASLRLGGIDHSQDGDLYEKFMKENYPEDWKTVKEQRSEKESQFQEKAEGARERVEARNEARIAEEGGSVYKSPEDNENPKDFIAERGADVPNNMMAKAEDISQMSRDELKSEFVDKDSYIYEPKYASLESERSSLSKEAESLREERKSLTEELKGEQKVKPKDEWDMSDELAALIGDKPMTYTERGEEINNRLEEIRATEKPIEERLMEVRDEMETIDRENAREQIEEWKSTEHPFTRGDIDKEYEGFSTTMGISAFDSDLKEGIGFIAEMSPDEYIDRVAYDIFGNTRENTVDIWYDNVKEYAEMMAKGVKFDMGYLNYESDKQEGRHRAMAAKLLGIEKIPVYIRGRSL